MEIIEEGLIYIIYKHYSVKLNWFIVVILKIDFVRKVLDSNLKSAEVRDSDTRRFL